MLMHVPAPNDAQSVRVFQLRLMKFFTAGVEKSLQQEGNREVDKSLREIKESV